ncbi:UDP-3-O-(3-hydroxymyristoyl)glucosamine N-acyltransferase [Thermocoleostomius sinensis]|jgi:UDP-3-O-[3-hydroxymyristoyl] glucosamine N-acyltransferase|uniref:UDP-3-O-acylglucosamine N-acyltransferase n=1 Tax=Thermocoleostomius sinensis A174 TaxID=2016057 RepID=A0A9E8ZD62_9CYAN|nr:UDP-3-O-(3-hydroxymyristoyl)glucosamine N-acyltransferase [Thermocoleostomius sinensis]WAL60973.1 UDP-3-O-(3-hydroxymyristoyl)glucosamine N-acyltransferase [Thermocoleostomius sinensis A174]
MKFSELLQALAQSENHSLVINPACDPDITGVAQVEQAQPGTISYIDGNKFASAIDSTGASALILPLDGALQTKATDREIAWVASDQPRKLFAETIAVFYQPFQLEPSIHPTAVIHPSVQLGKNVAIGAHVVIQAGATIGADVCIHPNVVIYPDVIIGDRTVLHANCTIHERTRIGKDCVIHSGAVIGAEGFGFVPTSAGWFKMQQSGYVILEDEVEVGCNSTIDRPALETTRIGRHTKIDNLVHVAHGCQVGEACIMAGQVGLAGAVTLGKRVILAGQVGIVDHVKIGDGAIASAKAGVHHDVEAGAIVTGIPAIPHKLFVKAAAVFSRLPEMYQTLRRLQKQK